MGVVMVDFRSLRGAGLFAAALLVAVSPSLAHHSFAMFDHARSVTLRGTVTKFQWTNPHGYIELDVREKDGKASHFTIELTSINMLSRQGWRSSDIKAGDKVKAIVSPLISGQAGGLLLEVTLPDGRVLDPGVPAGGTYKRTLDQERGI
jgi:hypothetical protein